MRRHLGVPKRPQLPAQTASVIASFKGSKTILREKIIEEVARNLIQGAILREWQKSKVVVIPKPRKDHKKTKGWRPINLINCIGKLGEKVVAEVLQGCGLLHKHQFGSVKGRSASKAALRTVTKA